MSTQKWHPQVMSGRCKNGGTRTKFHHTNNLAVEGESDSEAICTDETCQTETVVLADVHTDST